MDGNSHYYIMLEGNNEIFDVSVVDYLDIIKYNEGDQITIEYMPGDQANTVLNIK